MDLFFDSWWRLCCLCLKLFLLLFSCLISGQEPVCRTGGRVPFCARQKGTKKRVCRRLSGKTRLRSCVASLEQLAGNMKDYRWPARRLRAQVLIASASLLLILYVLVKPRNITY